MVIVRTLLGFEAPELLPEAVSPGGLVRSDGAEVRGDLDPAFVDAVIEADMAAIESCYEEALQASPELQAELVLRLSVKRSGKVFDAGVVRSSVNDALRACILQRFRSLRFGRNRASTPPEVVYPLTLWPDPAATTAR